ncbi:MAG: hypothetical protein ABII19_02985 [Patescibacteria group bacterium]
MGEIREIPFEVSYGEPRRRVVRGTIRVAGEELTASLSPYHRDYGYRVLPVIDNRALRAIGDTLGYPVAGDISDDGDGSFSTVLRRATPEEAAKIARIAACERVDRWPIPSYARREEMRREFEEAGLLLEVQVDSREIQTIYGPKKDDTWWLVDISTSAPAALSSKWAARAAEDCLLAAREGRWQEAYFAAELAVGEAPAERRAEMVALHVVTTANWKAPEHTVPAEERLEQAVVDFCCSYGADFARELQRQIDRLFGEIGLPGATLNVKKILQEYLAKHPNDRDSRLVKIVEEK